MEVKMPVYKYKCNKCSHSFEAQQNIGDELLEGCNKCDGEIYRVMTTFNAHFKGNGFACNDK